MQKMMSPRTTLVWVDEEGVVDPLAPTVAELEAGANLSAAVVRGYNLNPTASSTDDTASIVDSGNVVNPTYDNYEGSLTFFEEGDTAATAENSAYKQAITLFEQKGVKGYWYRRIGKLHTEAFASTDKVEGFYFMSDNPQTVDGGDNGGPIQMTVPFLQQGRYIPRGTQVKAA